MRYRITDNFHLDEFVHPDYHNKFGANALWFIDHRIITVAQELRDDLGVPITINNYMTGGQYKSSGLRTQGSKIGAKYSQHKYGRAIDCKFGGMTIKEVYDFILHNQDKYFGIGLSTIENIEHTPTWLHLDCRLTGLEEFKIVNP
jgi:hypothetical protein